MAKVTISRSIPCNRKLKEYNVNNLRHIADMSVSEVYNQLSTSSGIVTHKCAVCSKLLTTLIDKVGKFMPSEPMTLDDQKKVRTFQDKWLTHLQQQLSAISKPVTPTYLRDVVTQKLKAMGHDEVCDNIHIEWYIGEYKTTKLDPQKIAEAIIDRKGTVWEDVKPLVKDDYYNIRLRGTRPAVNDTAGYADILQAADAATPSPVPLKRSYIKGRHEDIVRVFEYIESFASTPGIETLDVRLRADIAIAEKVLDWRQQATTDYDYRTQFQFFLDQLQTLPDDVKDITFATLDDKTRKRFSKDLSDAKRKAKVKQSKKADVTPAKDKEAGNSSDAMPQSEASSMPTHAADGERQEETQNEEGEDVTIADIQMPDKDYVYTPSPEEILENNKSSLMRYLDNLSTFDCEAQRRIREAAADIDEFCRFEDFVKEFEDLQAVIKNKDPRKPGGFAVGTIHNKVVSHRQQRL